MSAVSALQPLTETLKAFQRSNGEIDQLIEGLFDELERMRTDVSTKLRELEDERQRVVDKEEQLASQDGAFAELSEQLDAKDTELRQASEELESVREQLEEQATDGSQDEELRDELATVRVELKDALAQLDDSRSELIEAQASAEKMASDSSLKADEAIQAQLQEAVAERDELLEELESVRSRAADLTDQVAVHDSQLTAIRSSHEVEIAKLRDSAVVKDNEPAAASNRRRSKSRPRTAEKPTGKKKQKSSPQDPVIDSVIAQFAKLQKDVASRRKS